MNAFNETGNNYCMCKLLWTNVALDSVSIEKWNLTTVGVSTYSLPPY
jgi:hypothetical protein